MKNIKSKTVLITGTTSGIGYELSNLFAKDGYRLILVSRDNQRLKNQQTELINKYGADIFTIAKDLSQPGAPLEVFELIQKEGLQVDILVNNAGFGVNGLFKETDPELELKMIAVNIIALTRLTKLFLPGMIKNGFGKILNLGSTGSFAPCPFEAVYCATKAYVLSFSNAIRAELTGTGVTVTTLCPGATRTEFPKKTEMEETILFKKTEMEAEQVALIAYWGLAKNKKVIIPGWLNKLMVWLIPLTPAAITEKLTIFLVKRNP